MNAELSRHPNATVDNRIVLRPPISARVFSGLFALVWFAFLSVGFVRGVRNGGASVIVLLLMMLFGGIIISANLRTRVIAEGDELRVRNLVREQRFRKSSVVRFAKHTPGSMPTAFGGMIAVLIDDGRMIDLRATARGVFGRTRRDAELRRLEEWLVH